MTPRLSWSTFYTKRDGIRFLGIYKERRPLYSVDHVVKEVVNAIWKHCYLRKLIDAATALELFRKLMKLVETQVIMVESEIMYLQKALEISLNSGLPIYDALYIAQAEKHGEILTSDEKQARVARTLSVMVHYIE